MSKRSTSAVRRYHHQLTKNLDRLAKDIEKNAFFEDDTFDCEVEAYVVDQMTGRTITIGSCHD